MKRTPLYRLRLTYPGSCMVRIEGPGGTQDQHLVAEVVREAIAG